ncbi:hypothetical protein [Maribacter thermophilus]|uniref:hypothetical protein n=1 Tax=Maribacter thermophilus TaxID=1197874 RepID=UPI000B034946|nr:hypothetical protein [Maribacter thermophilus]
MDVYKEILQKSALGLLTPPIKSLVLLLFLVIVSILFTMLVLLLKYGLYANISFGY